MLVPVVLDHAVTAYADIWAGDLHPSQGDPGDGDRLTGADTRQGKKSHPVCAAPSLTRSIPSQALLTG